MREGKTVERLKGLGSVALIFLLVIAVWGASVSTFNIPAYVVPSPHAVAAKAFEDRGELLKHTLVTVREAFLGYLLGALAGVVLAIAFSQSKVVKQSIYPYVIALKTTPIIALAPLLIIWFGHGLTYKVLTIGLMCLFPVLVNSVKGLASSQENELEFFKLLSASKRQVFFKYQLPNALPYVFTGLKISSTIAVMGAVVVELIGADKGLGFLIILASYYLNIDTMFAAIAAAALLGMTFFAAVSLLEKKIVFWHSPAMEGS